MPQGPSAELDRNTPSPLLDIRDLCITYRSPTGNDVPLVDRVSFQVPRGSTFGLAGESGCGKTTLALALLGLLPRGVDVTSGTITLNARDGVAHVERRTEVGMQAIRWRNVSLVFQWAQSALDPCMRVNRQIAEAISLHEPMVERSEVERRVRDLLDRVGIQPDRASSFPHELSGGMRQRTVIALALACAPEVLIADEPTTGLDAITQAQVLDLLRELRRDLGMAMILVSHDLATMSEICDRVAIMYAGQLVEIGPVASVFGAPQHPYTQRLLEAVPALGGSRRIADAIPGSPPDPTELPSGCRFHTRCHRAQARCVHDEPSFVVVGETHEARCLLVPWVDRP